MHNFVWDNCVDGWLPLNFLFHESGLVSSVPYRVNDVNYASFNDHFALMSETSVTVTQNVLCKVNFVGKCSRC